MTNDQQELDLGLNETENDFVNNLNYIKEKLGSINLNDLDTRTSANKLSNFKIHEIKNLISEIDKIITFYKKYTNLFNNEFTGERVIEGTKKLTLLLKGNDNFKEIFQEVSILSRKIYEQFLRFKSQTLFSTLEDELANAKNEVVNIRAARLAIEGQETEVIYSDASNDHLNRAQKYEVCFYLLLFAAGCITFVSFKHFPYSQTDIVDFVLSKVMILTVVITLGTIFLRKSSHARKLHDQAHQTSLELRALPLFIKSLEKVDQDEIIKDLAGKYFGKELDQTQNDKIGDLMQDQLSAGTELVRASAELVRAKSESGGNEENKS